MKDHENETVLVKYIKSQVRAIRAEASKEGIELKSVQLTEGETYSTKCLTTFWMTQFIGANVAEELREALKQLKQWISIKVVDDSLAGKTFLLVELA